MQTHQHDKPAAVVSLREYQTRRFSFPPPSLADHRAADQLTGRGVQPKLIVRWLADGEVEITASSWVGVVHFESFRVQVLPKLGDGSVAVLSMIQYADGLDLVRMLDDAVRDFEVDGTDLFELICALLVEETRLLLREGLLRDYRPDADTLRVLRGRLRLREHYARWFGRVDQLECEFDEYDGDVAENQYLAAAMRVATRALPNGTTKAAALRISSLLQEVCSPPAGGTRSEDFARRITYGRRNDRYRSAHGLARLVLDGAALEDLYSSGARVVLSFLFDMNVLFERFVTRLVEDALRETELSVLPQQSLRHVLRNDLTGHSYGSIRPDLIVLDTTTGRQTPIDIKYKRYEDQKVSPGDLYQTFLYAFSLAPMDEQGRAGLLYPASRAVDGPSVSIQALDALRPGARIVAQGLPVDELLGVLLTHPAQALSRVQEFVRRTISSRPPATAP